MAPVGSAAVSPGKMQQQRSEVRDGMRIDWDVPIVMDDGLTVRVDVFRPVKDGRYPVILTYGHMQRDWRFRAIRARGNMADKHPDVTAGSSNLYQSWEVVDPEKWVPHDYACVRVTHAAVGMSPGYIDHFSPRETKDFYDTIEWAGVQPWSNGKVGLNGISYYGINQWHVATLQPPHLAAMCIWEGAADWYRDMTHHGGILCTFWENWYDMQVKTVQYGRANAAAQPSAWRTGVALKSCRRRSLRKIARRSATTFALIRSMTVITGALADLVQSHRANVSAANWGGQGLHPRGNFEGLSAPQRKTNGLRRTASSTGHILHGLWP
jgi:putative CocE/NonD family hydrolase